VIDLAVLDLVLRRIGPAARQHDEIVGGSVDSG
jgi:hypothetical protein